jgi:hypothetical protein
MNPTPFRSPISMPCDQQSVEAVLERLRTLSRPPKAQAIASEVECLMGDASIDKIYRARVLSDRSRRYQLGTVPRNASVEIIYTLLGFELKIGRRRLLCPDLATARYLQVFAKLQCDEVAVPYDITRISPIADEIESSWHRMSLLADRLAAGRTSRFKYIVMNMLAIQLRGRISEQGAGEPFPQFSPPRRRRSKS